MTSDTHGGPTPPEWFEVIEGRQDGEDVADVLLQRGFDPTQVERDRRLFTPVPDHERRRMIEGLASRFSDPTSVDEDEATAEPLSSRGRFNPRSPWAIAVLTAMVAAVLLAIVGLRPSPSRDDQNGLVAPLGSRYQITLEGSTSDIRSPTTAGARRFSADTRIRLRAIPERAIDIPVDMAVFAYRDGEARRVIVRPRRGADGALELDGRVSDILGLGPGRWTLAVVIGPEGAIPDEPKWYGPETVKSTDGLQVEHIDIAIEQRSLDVRLSGCEVRLRHPCIVEPGMTLGAWIDHPQGDRAEVRVDGNVVSTMPYDAKDPTGVGLRIVLPTKAEELTITLPEALGLAPWSIRLATSDAVTGPDERAVLARIDEAHTRAWEAQQSEHWAQAVEWRRTAMELALGAGFLSRGLDAGVAAAFLMVRYVEDPEGATAVLDELGSIAERYPQGDAKLAYYRGVIAMTEGRIHEAAASYQQASASALRLGDQELARAALPMFALMSIDLGHYEQAMAWSKIALDSSEGHPCDLAANSRNAAWAAVLLGSSAGDIAESLGDPLAMLERSYESYAEGGDCADARKAVSTRISLAIAAAEQGEWTEAGTWLDGVDAHRLTSHERLWAADVRLRIHLATNRSDPTEALARLDDAAEDVVAPGARWRVAVRRGEVMEALGRLDDAIRTYSEAEALMDDMAALVKLGLGRDVFLTRRGTSAQRLVEALITKGSMHEAQCAARRARSRALPPFRSKDVLSPSDRARLDALSREYVALVEQEVRLDAELRSGADQRADARQTRRTLERLQGEITALLDDVSFHAPWGCSDLPPVDAGELLVVLFPLPSKLAVMGVDAERSVAQIVPSRGESAPIPDILRVLRPQLEAASLVKVVASGDACDIELHAAELDGAPLITHVPVVYAADWPRRPSAPAVEDRDAWSAVLVGDGTESLVQEVTSEVDSARRALEHGGWSVSIFDGDEIDVGKLRETLAGARLFHYAGHAEPGGSWTVADGPSLEANSRGWASRLELGRGRMLDVGQILLLPRAPDVVVLMGCRTGILDQQSLSGGMSLALAFLLAGSDAVVAASSFIDNGAAAELSRRMYSDVRGGFDAARALQRAQTAARHTLEASEWSKLRVWVP